MMQPGRPEHHNQLEAPGEAVFHAHYLRLDPPHVLMPQRGATGGPAEVFHSLINVTADTKLGFKIRMANGKNFTISPLTGVLEPGGRTVLRIRRLQPTESHVQPLIAIAYKGMLPEETSPGPLFTVAVCDNREPMLQLPVSVGPGNCRPPNSDGNGIDYMCI